jgi:hypothetical protein
LAPGLGHQSESLHRPDTGTPLPSWEQACQELTEPAHVARFGAQVHVKGILGGTEEAGRHIGYLTKYLTKSIGQAAGLGEHATDAQRDHARQLHAELQLTPCSPRCAVWLLYGIQPHGARHSMTPGRCKGNGHKPEHLGIAGRRVLVSRKWSTKPWTYRYVVRAPEWPSGGYSQVSLRTAVQAVAVPGSVAALAGCVASSGRRRSQQ